jgi:alpha-mannosidase
MKEYFPHPYELIKKYIREGRWHIAGSTWDATDANIPSPESFTRNILYGQHFYRDEFGVEGTDIFLPDCFGFGWTLPTIAAHSGLIGFSTQKLQWRNKPFFGNSKIPFEIGLWQGVDGSKIMLVADGYGYGTRWKDEDLSQNKQLQNIIDKNPLHLVYHYYGTGDTGGAPTIESVRAVEKGVKGSGNIEIVSATSDQLYKDFLPFDQHPELPVYNGELLMDVHGTGCYTSQAAMKWYNRRNELLADAAERSAVAADWLGGIAYPKKNLNDAWKRFIWHQFHDDLTGTSIPRAYEFSWNDELISLKQFSNVLTSSVGTVASALNTQVKGLPLVIYNPVSIPVSNILEVSLSGVSGKVSIYNEQGKEVPSQLLPASGGIKLLIAASVPASGYVVYDIRTSGGAKPAPSIRISGKEIENSVYKIRLDDNGDIASIFDKRYRKELVKEGKAIRLALFTENESFRWPAWEIMKKTMDATPVPITGMNISIAEQGPLRAALCVQRIYNQSTFKQYIRLSEGEQADRIDIVNDVDWQTTNALLKAEFPLSVSNPNATYDLGIGAVERGNNTPTQYEVYAQYWADLSDNKQDYGVSILNDSKYGWDKPDDNTLRLTLLHTPKTQGNYSYQSKQDFGLHQFTYSIVGHAGDYRAAHTVQKAEILNQPLKAFVTDKHKGVLNRNSFSFVQTDNENVLVKAIKQAEKSDEYVLRLYETAGKSTQKVSVGFIASILSAQELNGVEDGIKDLSFSGNQLQLEMKPFGMKTVKVKLASPAVRLKPTLSVAVPLPYNTKATSYDAFRREVNFDGKGNSFSAELFPETIDFNGVQFLLAGADEANAVKCKRDTIQLPKGKFNRLYLLATATQSDSKVSFTIDKNSYEAIVPVYSGFIGQWGHTGHTEGFLRSENVAYVGTHKHSLIHNKDLPYEYTYLYAIALDLPANARQLVLPDNSQVAIFAATLAWETPKVTPAVDLLNVNLPAVEITNGAFNKKNLLEGKPVIEKSGEVNASEQAALAFDDDINTKWCDNTINRPKYIAVDLGKEETIKGWSVFHAGLESLDWITKEFSLQVKQNAQDAWKTIDSVYDNTNIETDRLLQQSEKARYVRLNITKPDQSEGDAARIYDFQVY